MFGRRHGRSVGVGSGPVGVPLITLTAFLTLLAVTLSANGSIFGPWIISGDQPPARRANWRV